MARILLTGGAGYIGSHTYVALRAAGHEAVILDDFSNAEADVPARLERLTGAPVPVVRADVLDRAALDAAFADGRFDAIVHFAARKAVGESWEMPLAYVETNVGGLVTLMRAAEAAGVRRLVFSSTATVYGEAETFPIPETAPLSHASPYAFTKLTCEGILGVARGWEAGILRYFNPVGAHPSALIGEDPRGVPANLMPYLARVAAGTYPALRVWGTDYDTPDGTPLRDYIHVTDLARAHVLSVEALLDGRPHVVNVGTGNPASVLEMVAAFGRAVGRDLPYEVHPRREGDVARLYADVTRARAVLGFEAEHGIDAMCASAWAWTRARMAEAG